MPSITRDLRHNRTGFTLVEMLVSVGLIMLMMMLFAQIFQVAGGSVSTQRGLMENDQRARSIHTLLTNDLRFRTFRKVIPFAFNEDIEAPEAELHLRRGYFYISENVPADDTDDVLAFTIRLPTERLPTNLPAFETIYGRALLLGPNTNLGEDPTNYLARHPNQPEMDDGSRHLNSIGSSTAAEVVYFLRRGNLYRRVLLLRDRSDANSPVDDPQPKDSRGQRFFAANYQFSSSGLTPYPQNFSRGYDPSYYSLGPAHGFWHDFDYSAHPKVLTDGSYDGAWFNSLEAPRQADMRAGDLPHGDIRFPPNRYGHNTYYIPSLGQDASGGQPREYDSLGVFFGRLTHEETSALHPQTGFALCQYPHLQGNTYATDLNLMYPATELRVDTSVGLTQGAIAHYELNNIVYSLAGGSRRGEDLVLSYVHAFDVKVWDDAAQQFVDIGHNLVTGDYRLSMQRNRRYGPAPPGSGWDNRVFDTWWPFFDGNKNQLDFDSSGSIEPGENDPPYLPLKLYPQSAASPPRWSPTTAYSPGQLIFPSAGTQPGDPFYYVCVAETAGTSGNQEPVWPRIPGLRVTDGDLMWQAVDNRKPLRAIQITLRFLDPSTQQLRNLTIQQSLAD